MKLFTETADMSNVVGGWNAMQIESAVENTTTFTQFLNVIGNISEALYLASHPEESDEASSAIVMH